MEALYIHIATKLEKIRFGQIPVVRRLDLSEVKTKGLWRAVLAEFLATMLFIFMSVMSAMTVGLVNASGADFSPGARLVKVSFAFGLSITTLIQMFGHVSGGHINPAVSVAMAVSGELQPIFKK